MTPTFAKAVDPIFWEAIKIKESIERNERVVVADLRARLTKRIEDAEHQLGRTQEWLLSKYAICAWIDSMLIEAPWEGKTWWRDKCLEKLYFGAQQTGLSTMDEGRTAHEDFFKKAIEASALPTKNALEVFFLSVVMGFRGVYDDRNANYRAAKLNELHLPGSIDAWCQSVGQSLQLQQGRPAIPEQNQMRRSPKPLRGKELLVQYGLITSVLVGIAAGIIAVFFFMGQS